MKQLNPFKIVALAIFNLVMPRKIKRKFYFNLSPAEHLAIGTTMTKVKYWRHFIIKHKRDSRLHFASKKYFS